MNEVSSFQPSWISPPGDTMSEILRSRHISVADFSDRMSQSLSDTQALLEGRTAITLLIARRLQETLGGSVQFWMARDFQYRRNAARLHDQDRAWLSELPLADIYRFQWIDSRPDPSRETEALLRFFDVPSVSAWRSKYEGVTSRVSFRTSPSLDSRLGAVATWLRRGEVVAIGTSCPDWNREEFRKLLPTLRKLSREKSPTDFLPKIKSICLTAGVVVVAEPLPSGCRASGATTFVLPNRALLLLSFRHLTDDHFWFTFFHECGHLILHGNDQLFIDGMDNQADMQETEANLFAANVLVPERYAAELRSLPLTAPSIVRFARKVGVSAGVIVGQLQHFQRIHHQSVFNKLKRGYKWTSSSEIQPRKARK